MQTKKVEPIKLGGQSNRQAAQDQSSDITRQSLSNNADSSITSNSNKPLISKTAQNIIQKEIDVSNISPIKSDVSEIGLVKRGIESKNTGIDLDKASLQKDEDNDAKNQADEYTYKPSSNRDFMIVDKRLSKIYPSKEINKEPPQRALTIEERSLRAQQNWNKVRMQIHIRKTTGHLDALLTERDDRVADGKQILDLERKLSLKEFFYEFHILPENKYYQAWRFIYYLFLVYFLLTFPLRLAFGNDKEMFWKYIAVDIASDVYFLIDVILTFFVSINQRGEYIHERKRIALDYLTGFFALDLVCSIPFQVFAPAGVQIIKMFRVLQIVPVIDMWSEIPKKIVNSFGRGILISSLATFIGSVYFYITVISFLLHVYACIWIAIGDPSNNNVDDETWILNLKNYTYDPINFAEGSMTVYLNAIYFVVTTFCTVGYGDVLPINNREYIFVMFVQFFGVAQFGLAVSQSLKYTATFKTQEQEDADEIEDLTDFIFRYEKSVDLAGLDNNPKLIHKTFMLLKERIYNNYGDLFLENEFYNDLLITEKFPLADIIFSKLCEKFKDFFGGLSKNFVYDLIPHLLSRIYFAGDEIIGRGEIPKGVFFITEGEVLVTCRDANRVNRVFKVLKRGDFFGESCLNSERKNHFHYYSKHQTKCYLIESSHFLEFARHYDSEMFKLKTMAFQKYRTYTQEKKAFLKTVDLNDGAESIEKFGRSPSKRFNFLGSNSSTPGNIVTKTGKDNSVLANHVSPKSEDQPSSKIFDTPIPEKKLLPTEIAKQPAETAKKDPKTNEIKIASKLIDARPTQTLTKPDNSERNLRKQTSSEMVTERLNSEKGEMKTQKSTKSFAKIPTQTFLDEAEEVLNVTKAISVEKKAIQEENQRNANTFGLKLLGLKQYMSEESDVTSVASDEYKQSESEKDEGSEIDDENGYLSEIYPLEAVAPPLGETENMLESLEYFRQKSVYMFGKLEIMKRKTQYKMVKLQRYMKIMTEKRTKKMQEAEKRKLEGKD